MGEKINFEDYKKHSKIEKEGEVEKTADVIDFQKPLAEKQELQKQGKEKREEIKKITGEENIDENKIYKKKFIFKKLNTLQRIVLKDYLAEKYIMYIQTGNTSDDNHNNVEFDLNFHRDEIPYLLDFFKEHGLEYSTGKYGE